MGLHLFRTVFPKVGDTLHCYKQKVTSGRRGDGLIRRIKSDRKS